VATVIPATFKSDRTTNYEVGVKSDLIPGRLSIDAAAYHVDWSDIQLQVFDGVVNGNANGGSAETQGVEWTVTLSPRQGLSILWAGAYTDAKITSDTDPIIVGALDGDPLPYAPEWSSSLDAEYEWTLSGGYEAYVAGSWRYVGKQSSSFPGVNGFLYGAGQIELPSYNVFDLRGGVDLGRFTVEVYAKNLGDERGPTGFGGFGQTMPDTAGAPNGEASVLRPRTIGVSVAAQF